MRINQFLAKNLGISRRGADELIREKQVKINSEFANLFDQVEPSDLVQILDQDYWKSIATQKEQTILIYKQPKCLTTRMDEANRPTIYDFIPKTFYQLKPAGRLDYLSEGLLVLTNNGILLEKLTHPRFLTNKEYLVGLQEKLSKSFLDELKQGFVLDGYKLNPVKVKQITYTDPIYHKYQFLDLKPNYVWYLFTLSEGRNNEIRKLCELQNQKVFRLIRVKHGDFEITKELFNKKLLTKFN